MNERIKWSNRLNRATGGGELLFCTRVYYNSNVWGGFWIALRTTIDTIFYLLERDQRHCRRCWHFERRHYGQAKGKTNQICVEAQKRKATGNKTSQETGETGTCKNRIELQPEEWRQIMNEQGDLFGEPVTCCNEECCLRTWEPIVVKRYTNRGTITLRFCTEDCEHQYYLKSLRIMEGNPHATLHQSPHQNRPRRGYRD